MGPIGPSRREVEGPVGPVAVESSGLVQEAPEAREPLENLTPDRGIESNRRRAPGGKGRALEQKRADERAYWRDNLRLIGILLAIWFLVSYVLGILLVEPLNEFRVAGFPLGFWFAHQGSIYVFVVLIWVYARWMDRIDRRHGVG